MVSAFAQTLRRYTSLNHLAQAARAVLQNTSQINQMLSDLNRVDFANVQVSGKPHIEKTNICVAHGKWMCRHSVWGFLAECGVFVVSNRSRRRGCVSATKVWFSVWSRTLRSPCSSRALWTSGPPGWITWSLRFWSLTRAAPVSPKLHASSCSNGLSTGLCGWLVSVHTSSISRRLRGAFRNVL